MHPNAYEVAQFILENGSELKTDIEPVAGKFYDLKPLFFEHKELLNIFEEKYKDFFCMILAEKLHGMNFDLTYVDLRSMVTPELIEELHGQDYFEYE